MIRNSVWPRKIRDESTWGPLLISSLFPVVAIIATLLVSGALVLYGPYAWAVVLGAMIMAIILLLRQYELALAIMVAIHLYIDFYIGLHLVALLMLLVLLIFFSLTRSSQWLWRNPSLLGLWGIFLIITIYPAIHGALDNFDAATFYPGNVFGAFLIFWLGTLLAQDNARVRRFCMVFAGLGALLAIHTIIQATTGKVLLESSHAETLLANVSDYLLAQTANRAGSFFVDPNWNGTFLAMMSFLPLGLFVERPSLLAKLFFLAEAVLILPAMLFTYSSGAWIGFFAGVIAFIVFAGKRNYRFLLPLLFGAAALMLIVAFPSQIALQLLHASDKSDAMLRAGAWQTALQVIRAFPLTGVGLGYQAYLLRSGPYRVPAQTSPLSHPHNAYLEWGAMAGFPVLLIFLMLLACSLWLAIHNWASSDTSTRCLLGGIIAAVIELSVNSWTINGWTHPVLGMVGWLLLGLASSPLLKKMRIQDKVEEKHP